MLFDLLTNYKYGNAHAREKPKKMAAPGKGQDKQNDTDKQEDLWYVLYGYHNGGSM